MVCEPDLITSGEAMYMKYFVIYSGWYTIRSDYLNKWDWGVILDFGYTTFLSLVINLLFDRINRCRIQIYIDVPYGVNYSINNIIILYQTIYGSSYDKTQLTDITPKHLYLSTVESYSSHFVYGVNISRLHIYRVKKISRSNQHCW